MISQIAYKYCKNLEEVENYDLAVADNSQIWHCHHRLECCFTMEFLKKMNLYYNQEPDALIFLTKSEHMKLKHAGRHRSEEFRKKISESMKGENNYNYGKHLSEETRKKLSESHRRENLSEETRKKMSANHADFRNENHPKYNPQARIDFLKCKNYKEFMALGYSCNLYYKIKNEMKTM
ncbi:MAG: hypothetical protein HUJ56_05040 [Erysipelotrichaceae bacterium]|nr:hypothetical protein [Erysipelotrichaceae bacterium]